MMLLYSHRSKVLSGQTFSPSDYLVLPEHKRVLIEAIMVGTVNETTGLLCISLVNGGIENVLVDDYPLVPNDQGVTIYPHIHLEVGQGLRFSIKNLGDDSDCYVTVIGVN